MIKNLTLGLCALLLAACSPSAATISTAVVQVQASWTAVPSQTPYASSTPRPTYTVAPTDFVTVEVTVEVTRLVDRPVTVTPTETPLQSPMPSSSPTITPLPSETPTATPTKNAAQTATAVAFGRLIADHPSGIYLVNVDIAPGVWRNNGTGNDCYWERTTRTGDIIDNHFGQTGGTMFISPSDFAVRMNNCGAWTYLGPP